MLPSALHIVQAYFYYLWQLFNSWHFPGTNITPAELLFFLLFVPLIIKFIRRIFYLDGSKGDE